MKDYSGSDLCELEKTQDVSDHEEDPQLPCRAKLLIGVVAVSANGSYSPGLLNRGETLKGSVDVYSKLASE